jgi:cytochrome c-type biogenesis protein CcmH
MNITFWALMIAMLLVAIAILVFPLLKVRNKSSIAYKDSNLKINEEKIRELDIDLEEGRIDQQYYKVARDELDRELLLDIPSESQQTAAQHYTGTIRRHPAWALSISVFVPTLVLLLYLDLGMHVASDETAVQTRQQGQRQMAQQQGKGQASVEEMAQRLETRLREKGGTAQDWAMLGRARKYLGDNERAEKAFAVARENDADNVQLMLESAEVIALNNGRQFTPEALALVRKAYSVQPDNANVLWFIGVAEYQQGNYHQAIDHLKKLLPSVLHEEDVVKSVVSVVAQSRQALVAAGEKMPELAELLGVPAMAGGAGQPVASATASSPQQGEARSEVSTSTAVKQGEKVTVAVDISSQAREKFSAGDTVFVYAKAKQGPRMPLAVQRLTLAELPTTVTLDDSMAMMQGMNMSAFEQLVISARVSKSGSAIAQSGDYIGRHSIEQKTGDDSVSIIIDTVVP